MPLGVREVLARARAELQALGECEVTGEVGCVSKSGVHAYFPLKEGDTVLPCALFAGALARLGGVPREGLVTTVRGKLNIYAKTGACQLVVEGFTQHLDAAGELARAREAAVAALTAEGVFARAKRPLPAVPRHVALVTAARSAALADMRAGLAARWPALRCTLVPSAVQGDAAPAALVAALARAAAAAPCLVVLARGGGSREDLAAFDDPRVVRAVAACPVPIVVAVGHETDHSLCDAAADLRAKTPTAAVEVAVPDRAALGAALAAAREAGVEAARAALATATAAVASARAALATAVARSLAAAHARLGDTRAGLARAPGRGVAEARGRAGAAEAKLRAAFKRTAAARRGEHARARAGLRRAARDALLGRARELAGARASLRGTAAATLRRERAAAERARAALGGLDPAKALARGYALLRERDGGAPVRAAAAVRPGARLCVAFADGEVVVTAE